VIAGLLSVFSGRRWLAAGAAGLALVAGLFWFRAVLTERLELREKVADSAACTAAVKSGGDLLICPQPVADAATQARRYLECDAALAEGRIYGVASACSAAVKRRDAEAEAAAHEARQLEAELTRTRASAQAALSRAQSRAQALLRKDQNAALALSRAPVGAHGRVRCDDQCLRELLGE